MNEITPPEKIEQVLRPFADEARHLTTQLNIVASDMIRDKGLVKKLETDPQHFTRTYGLTAEELEAMRAHDVKKLYQLGLHPFLLVRFAGMVGVLEYWQKLGRTRQEGRQMKKLFAALVLLLPALATAQYPAKPIRLFVPILAGGPLDAVARVVSQSMSQGLGQQVVIKNRPGADGAIAAQAVLSSPADGYTLFFSNNTAVVGAPLLNKGVTYDAQDDFAQVSFVGRMTLVIWAHPDAPTRSIKEMVEAAKASPGKLTYATNTIGDVIAGAQLTNAAGVTMLRVPYKGAAQSIPEVVAGRVNMVIAPLSAGLGLVKEGRLRGLAVILPARSPTAPDIPTIAEAGLPGVNVTTWAAVFGPKGLPRDVTARLAKEVADVVQRPEARAAFDKLGFRPESTSPEGLASLVKQEFAVWSKIIKDNNITQDQ